MAYKSTKPVSTDRKKRVAVEMKENFRALGDAWEVDHQRIDEETQGHKKLTFPQQGAAPTTGATEGALFARNSSLGDANAAELCFRRLSNGLINEFTSSGNGGDGWFQLPSGILVKWFFGKTVAAAAAATQTHTWNAAGNYPAFSEVYWARVYLSPASGSPGVDINAQAYVDAVTTTTVTWYTWRRSESNTAGTTKEYRANILAIGKGPGT